MITQIIPQQNKIIQPDSGIIGKKNITQVVLLFFFLHFLNGCSAQAKDKLLRAFFDGVPPPEEERPLAKDNEQVQTKTIEPETDLAPKAPVQFIHQPFLENQCDICHDTKYSQRIAVKGKDLCFSCHDDFTKDKFSLHYPVSEGDCLACHDPHKSANKFMLKEAMPEICFSCHDEKGIKDNPTHEGQNNCSQCHNPHASNEEKLLK